MEHYLRNIYGVLDGGATFFVINILLLNLSNLSTFLPFPQCQTCARICVSACLDSISLEPLRA